MKKLSWLVFSTVFILNSCTFISGYRSNVQKEGFIHIPRKASFEQVMDSLSPYLKDAEAFKKYAEEEGYPNTIKSGKYKLEKGEQNADLLDKLQRGEQVETKLSIRNYPTLYHMVGSVAKQINVDSIDVITSVMEWANNQDSTLTDETVKQYFIPETYFVYWNMTADDFMLRMQKEYRKVWNEKRLEYAKERNLTTLQVVTLASIVQMEAASPEEQKKVAKAYFNRLNANMLLQADPTSIYAYKLQNGFDNKIQRVYNKHLNTASQYNTYKVKGLPPAPICLPNLSAIDAVLQPDDHEYVYFCADPDRPGKHSFTNSYAQHLKNAEKYRNWLKDKGIQ